MSMLSDAEIVPIRPWMIGASRRPEDVRVVVLHFTGSGIAARYPDDLELEYDSSVNWINSANNYTQETDGYEWGGCWNVLVSQTRVAIGVPLDIGCRHGCGIVHDPIAYNVELTLPDWHLAWPADLVERAAQVTAELCLRSNIPAVYLPWLSYDNHEAPGITSHRDTRTGRTSGKRDFPSVEFPWDAFLARVKELIMPARDLQVVHVSVPFSKSVGHGFFAPQPGCYYVAAIDGFGLPDDIVASVANIDRIGGRVYVALASGNIATRDLEFQVVLSAL